MKKIFYDQMDVIRPEYQLCYGDNERLNRQYKAFIMATLPLPSCQISEAMSNVEQKQSAREVTDYIFMMMGR